MTTRDMAMNGADKPVVVFGGGGFLGRRLAQELLSSGYRVRIAQRNPGNAVAIRSLGDMGQTQFVTVDIANAGQVRAALTGAGAAINLVGLLRGKMQTAHVEGARNIAEAAADAGLDALVHISAIGADSASPSTYGRTKGEGEAAVRAAFPAATILRPSIIFGPDDQFTNRFARLIVSGSALPLCLVPVIRGETRFQPVDVSDVARAITLAIGDPARFGGQLYELGGPDILSLAQLNAWIADEIGRKVRFLPVPDGIARAIATLTGWAPGAPITRDQFQMLLTDNIVAPDARGLAAFDIRPTPLAALAPAWLARYRRPGQFGHIVSL